MTSNQIRSLQDKPEAKLTSGMLERAMAAAETDSKTIKGPDFDRALEKHYADEVNTLPSDTVQETIKGEKAGLSVVSPTRIIGATKARLDP